MGVKDLPTTYRLIRSGQVFWINSLVRRMLTNLHFLISAWQLPDRLGLLVN